MKCEICRGACCTTMFVPKLGDADSIRWTMLHGVDAGKRVLLNCVCNELTTEGRCGIYENRPEICRTYPAGGKDCLDTVRLLRTSEEYDKIRDDWDPVSIHGEPA